MDIILHAKIEYTKQLQKLVKKPVYDTFMSIFEQSKNEKEVLKNFQTKLINIPNWNQDNIHLKYKEIVSPITDELFEKLIQAIVISNVRIFGAIKKNSNAKIEVTLPDAKQFVHKIYIQCARFFYERPYLFENRLKKASLNSISKNKSKVYNIINESVEETIRSVLPFSSILEEYFKEETEVIDDLQFEEINNVLAEQNTKSQDNEEEQDTKTIEFEEELEEAKEEAKEDDNEGDKEINLEDEESDTNEELEDEEFFNE